MEMPNDGVALEGRLVEAEDDGGKSFKGSDRMPSSLHLSTQAASSSVFEEDGDAREGQQNKELKKFEDVQVYLGELLHFGVVLIPQDGSAAAAGSPTAARAWLRKYASLSAALDLVLRDGSSRIKAAGQSALSCQFWEAQAFPIDSQEAVSIPMSQCDGCWLYVAFSASASLCVPSAAAAVAGASTLVARHCCGFASSGSSGICPSLSPILLQMLTFLLSRKIETALLPKPAKLRTL
ncbi:hypothetical protein cyc_06885 [Cyclospora cayetanensis]|uniref:Uncharacterized protein n=1 Tax=Cyclospora cayetanensis TaxID=88456 RepID=A0A1D3D3A1_9EIME|nr:hypothetical protein cyc_06885 [Cyclospora cayetanensis]